MKKKSENALVFITKPSKTIWESNALIGSRRHFTLLQEKILTALCDKIKPFDKENQLYEISLSEISEITELNSRNWEEIYNAILGLVVKPVHIPLEKSFEVTTVLLRAIYTEGKNSVQVQISHNLLPHLINLKSDFTKYDRDIVYGMKSVYGIRFYKLICQNAFKKTWRIKVEDLREQLGLTNEYVNFKDFRKRVVEPALADLRAKHIEIQYSELKGEKGKKIETLEFCALNDLVNGVPVEKILENLIKAEKEVNQTHEEWLMAARPELPKFLYDAFKQLKLTNAQLEALRSCNHQELGKVLNKIQMTFLNDDKIRNKSAFAWNELKRDLPELQLPFISVK